MLKASSVTAELPLLSDHTVSIWDHSATETVWWSERGGVDVWYYWGRMGYKINMDGDWSPEAMNCSNIARLIFSRVKTAQRQGRIGLRTW